MKKSHRFLAGLLCGALLCSMTACAAQSTSTVSEQAAEVVPLMHIRELSTAELVEEMGVGWNLGSSLESYEKNLDPFYVSECETAWGNPETTREMIAAIGQAGFQTVRIPVTWSNMMSSAFVLDAGLLRRVQEVVDYVLDAGMYAVLDVHSDQGWLRVASTDYDYTLRRFTAVWRQIAAHFQNYSDYLLFESMNEDVAFDDLWNPATVSASQKQEAYDLLLKLNQTFVNTVRAGGGNNPKRHLLIAGYGGEIKRSLDTMYQMPTDDAGRCALALHYYEPSAFANKDAGMPTDSWGSAEERTKLVDDMKKLETRFVGKGIPVVLTEYGAMTLGRKADTARAYTAAVTDEARKHGICPILWDDGKFFDRNALTFRDAALLTEIKQWLSVAEPVVEDATSVTQ